MICKTCATAADLGTKHYCTEPGCACQHRGAEPTTSVEIHSYYGPTAWDSDAGSLWHRDCPDTVGDGHDGRVVEDDDGAYCWGCHAFQPTGTEGAP